MESNEIREHFRVQTIKVGCNAVGKVRCITPSMMAERAFKDTEVVGIVENPKKKYMIETRVSPTLIRRRLKSRVFGIAN